MDVVLDVMVEARDTHRVVLTVSVSPPEGAVASVDGVRMQLQDTTGEALGPVSLLPVAGTLAGPLTLSVELRSNAAMPDDARVVVVAWSGADQEVVEVPASPFVRLQDMMRGDVGSLATVDDVELGPLTPEAERLLRRRFPWVFEPLRAASGVAVIEADDTGEAAAAFARDLGLGEEDAAWLRDLVEED